MQLSRTYKRTVVFTIHQPRSNIVALFDKLVLLANGKLVYSGKAADCQTYFTNIGSACPPGYNIADYLSELWFSLRTPAYTETLSFSRPHHARRDAGRTRRSGGGAHPARR